MQEFFDRIAQLLGELVVTSARGTGRIRFEFLAHVFAVCTVLQERWSQACEQPDLPEIRGWKELSHFLADCFLRPVKPELLYERLLFMLLELEQGFGWEYGDGELPPSGTVDLTSISLDGQPALFGSVAYWVRPRSMLRDLTMKRDQDGGPARYGARPVDQLRHLGFWWNRGMSPGLSRVTWKPRLAPALLDPCNMRRSSFRVALCPLSGVFFPRFALIGDGRFAAHAQSPMHEPDALTKHMQALLQDAREHAIDLLVMPELTVHEPALQGLKESLSAFVGREPFPRAVIAGSFHVEEDAGRWNRAPVLDQDGRVVWAHEKRGRFRLTGRQVHAMTGSAGAPGLFVGPVPAELDKNREIIEAIHHGAVVRILDTPIGRMAVLICADAIDSASGYSELVKGSGIDLLIVVSMSDETRPFLRWAEEMRRLRTAVLFVNAGCVLKRMPAPELAAFVSLPFRQEKLPTRIRWRHGAETVELVKKLDDQDSKDFDPDGSALQFLPDGRGLVVDLGAWWRETHEVVK